MAEDAWNSRDPETVSLAYTPDSLWRNRGEFLIGRDAIVVFLTRKWARELDYRLLKEVWAHDGNRIAVRFAYEWRDDSGNWFRSYGNENWEFDDAGLMARRIASINDRPIAESERRFHWPLGRRPDDYPSLGILTNRADAVPALAEVFREHGFEGASLSTLSKATGLGKGSLYNFFPGGKEEMMDAVLADIDQWFATTIFSPLEQARDPAATITAMVKDVTAYFQSGGRVCLIGSMCLGSSGDPFSSRVRSYFSRWISALTHCLDVGHLPSSLAMHLAEETVSGIQGAIVLARALSDEATFVRIVHRNEAILLDAVACNSR
jgi:TetR/AcrR family transcriptional repressor of lmrAB and yxaGH operons